MIVAKKNRIFGLDFLRAVAISLVVISHSTYLLFPIEEYKLVTLIRVFGAIGVDLFFVLSGFLIGGILLKMIDLKNINLSDLFVFWKRRWLRTLPNYFLVLLLNIALYLLIGLDLPNNIGSYFLFLQNFDQPHPNFFTEAWSLSIEEYAYILLPLILFSSFILFKRTDKIKLFIKITLAIILLLLILKVNYYLNVKVDSYKQWSATFRKVVLYRLDAIYIGFLVVYLSRHYVTFIVKYRVCFLFIGLSMLFGLHFFIHVFKLLPQTHFSFYVFVYLEVLLLSLGLLLPFFSTFIYQGVFRVIVEYISKHSYAIYLVNYSLVLLPITNFFNLGNMSFFEKGGVLILFMSVTLGLSHVIYNFFEKPILSYRDKKYS